MCLSVLVGDDREEFYTSGSGVKAPDKGSVVRRGGEAASEKAGRSIICLKIEVDLFYATGFVCERCDRDGEFCAVHSTAVLNVGDVCFDRQRIRIEIDGDCCGSTASDVVIGGDGDVVESAFNEIRK